MTSEDRQLKELHLKLRGVSLGCQMYLEKAREIHGPKAEPGLAEGIAALDLAIRIAEAIAANPRGFRNWAKTTGFEI